MTRESEQIEKARELRRTSTPTEQLLWRRLRDRRFAGFKFRRQHALGPYVVDFYCAAAGVIVELDGESHLHRQEYDARRTQFIEELGLVVLRFWNTEVFDETEAVLEAIYQACLQGCKLTSLSMGIHEKPPVLDGL